MPTQPSMGLLPSSTRARSNPYHRRNILPYAAYTSADAAHAPSEQPRRFQGSQVPGFHGFWFYSSMVRGSMVRGSWFGVLWFGVRGSDPRPANPRTREPANPRY